jgi:hypothetical protein
MFAPLSRDEVGFPSIEEEQEFAGYEPEPPFMLAGDPSPEEQEKYFATTRYRTLLHIDVFWSAFRLAELSEQLGPEYREGLEIPLGSRAAATGAIALSYVAVEAELNDILSDVGFAREAGCAAPEARAIELRLFRDFRG